MKKAPFIFTALAVFALTGCEMGSTSTVTGTDNFVMETREDDGTDIYVTKFEYDFNNRGYKTKETKTKNGMPYQESNFVMGLNSNGVETQTCTRVTTNDNGSRTTHKLVSTYGLVYWDEWGGVKLLETLFEMFDEVNPEAPIEVRETEYDDEGQIKNYLFTNTDGVMVRRDEYRFTSGSQPTQTYREIKNGGTPVRYGIRILQWSNNTPLEYEIRKNITLSGSGEWDGESGDLIEEQVDHEIVSSTTSWSVKKYDDEGNLISNTYVENKLERKSFSY